MRAPDACQIFTPAQISAAMDGETPRVNNHGHSTCNWYLTNTVTYMTLADPAYGSADAARTEFASVQQRETDAPYSTSVRPEPGFGEAAFSAFYSNYRAGFGREVFVLLTRDFVVTINLADFGGDAALRRRVETLAGAVVTALKGASS